ncbi:tRNA nucleotidyltransferase/poly(A) polymerase [Desulfosporosinus acidiphilus SJ4]|uniref:tRNA nucleotidyltransferase/poly(A) polymerase n=1 Tax=Desulfosporosinus acidiphilus (strain DSM 22704 / JCM 16185 / SJ4) TaxID=646529 RepID=I4D4L3_DESAJ|nr:tRNA nucleotidyltransferase/poly(A) polymerase [Desulfosporosinus acidiphilus]AFM40737.1 tRNA nucleotidyltransferase/poly(A) polymerase [Desulfosporosinus acidiphilus SJ4]
MLSTSFQQEVLERLSQICPVYRVGGSVRDAQLGISSKDVDAIAALSQEQICENLRCWGYTPHLLGANVQTVSLFRETDRLDLVSFSGELERDASRRDFTINAIYQDVKTGEIVDPFQGLRDLKDHHLRACGKASERFQEDPLRVLRLVRFAVSYGLSIEAETWQSAIVSMPKLSMVSRERVTEELGKILVLDNMARSFSLLDELGFFQRFIPELSRLKGLANHRFNPDDGWNHTRRVVQNTPNKLILRLAALFHELGIGEISSEESLAGNGEESAWLTREIFSRFRWSMVLAGGIKGEQEVEFLVKHHMLGNIIFGEELQGANDWREVSLKARGFAWDMGWNGQVFDSLRVESLLGLWQADFQSGDHSGDDLMRLGNLQEEIKNACIWISGRLKTLNWQMFWDFVQEKGLEGKPLGRFKEQVRRVLMLEPEQSLNDVNFLEREYDKAIGQKLERTETI